MRWGSAIQRAFTLIEMLLVVAVISLLIAILLPSLWRAKEHANVAICMTRLNQIGNAATTYLSSNRNYFASAFNWTQHVTCWHDWHQKERVTDGLLFPYIRSYDLYLCPTFLATYKHGDKPYSACGDTGPSIIPYYSYTMNASMGWQGWAGFTWKTPKVIRNPSRMLFYSEESTWAVPGWSGVSINNGAIGAYADGIATYHLPERGDLNTGRGNVLFLDLHVDLRHASETIPLAVQ